jgi:predicted NBD/HSP70 family sugar kinase
VTPGVGTGIGLDSGATNTLGVVVDGHGAIRASIRPTARAADGAIETAAEVGAALLGKPAVPVR